jgi:hypothetical protein
MNPSRYPLEQLGLIKQKKLDEAEKVLREKKKILEKEEEKLLVAEKERDIVKEHRFAKLTQLRQQLDEGAPATKVTQARQYLKLVDEKLKVKEQKVKEQKKAVDAANAQVEIARADLIRKQYDVEKIQIHRTEWEKEQKALEQLQENIETDELGSTFHERHKRKRKK